MKKYLKWGLAALCGLLVSHAAQAQLYLSGGALISHHGNSDTSYVTHTNNWSLSPEIGYKFSENKSIGIQTSFSRTKSVGELNNMKSRLLTVSPYFRWDFCSTEYWTFGIMPMAYYSSSSYWIPGYVNNIDIYKTGGELRMVADLKLADHWALVAQASLLDVFYYSRSQKYQNDYVHNDDKDQTFSVNLTLGEILFGVKYTF